MFPNNSTDTLKVPEHDTSMYRKNRKNSPYVSIQINNLLLFLAGHMMPVTAPWVQSKVTPGIFELGPVLAQHAHAPQLDRLDKVFVVVKSDHSTQIDSNLLLGNAVFITVKNVSCSYYYNVMVPQSHSGDGANRL